MNLLIPTNDGISIAPDFDEAHKFRILSVVNGSVDKDEIRILHQGIEKEFQSAAVCPDSLIPFKNEMISQSGKKSDMKYHYLIIANNISKETEKNLNENNFDVLLTTETNITNAIIYYLRYHSTSESDYCCCP
jgi:hypothetical protein